MLCRKGIPEQAVGYAQELHKRACEGCHGMLPISNGNSLELFKTNCRWRVYFYHRLSDQACCWLRAASQIGAKTANRRCSSARRRGVGVAWGAHGHGSARRGRTAGGNGSLWMGERCLGYPARSADPASSRTTPGRRIGSRRTRIRLRIGAPPGHGVVSPPTRSLRRHGPRGIGRRPGAA